MPYQYADTLDDELLYERIESFGGGMDGFARATLLRPDQSQYLQNLIVPDNLVARTRPGADSLGNEPGGAGCLVQGLAYFDAPNIQQLIAGSNAALWKYESGVWSATTGYTLSDAGVGLEAAQGVDKLLCTDGVGNLASWNGSAWTGHGNTSGTTTSDPPVASTVLCWHAGRMFASGQASNRDTIWASFLLEFGDGKWNHTNFSWRVGGGEGESVVALASLQNYNLAVLKQNSVYLVVTDPTANEASDWTIQKVASGVGCVGRWARCNHGNDLLFMARDGVRSLRRMQSAAGQYDLSPPLSQPIQPWIDRINWAYAHKIAAASFRELVLWAVPLDNATSNNTVLAWNGRLGCWLGVWTGWNPSCWAVSRFSATDALNFGQPDGRVRRYKADDDPDDDGTYLEDGAPIASRLDTRALLFGEPVNDKDGYHAEARFSATNAQVTFTWLTDLTDVRTWTADLRQTGVDLPLDLPFDLAGAGAQLTRRGLRGLAPWNEAYLRLESAEGWWSLRNLTVSAFLRSLRNQ